jgi:hypothetical protein
METLGQGDWILQNAIFCSTIWNIEMEKLDPQMNKLVVWTEPIHIQGVCLQDCD